jgi:phosphoribosylpyrophosphate synthetase
MTERPEPATVEAVTRRLRGEVTVLEPRKMWPGGAFGSRGRIPVGLMAETGRAIVYADAPEWRELVASTFVRDGAPSPELRDALWRDAIRVNDQLLSAVCGKVVLLLVDATSTQWPITVAAAHLRQAEASMVLPLLVHRRP